MRLIGVSLSGLTDFVQQQLFELEQPEGAEPQPVAPQQLRTSPGDQPPAGLVSRYWRAGDDVRHTEYGHGWVQGSGHGRVTVRFETRSSGPGPARTVAAEDPALTEADPLSSLE